MKRHPNQERIWISAVGVTAPLSLGGPHSGMHWSDTVPRETLERLPLVSRYHGDLVEMILVDVEMILVDTTTAR